MHQYTNMDDNQTLLSELQEKVSILTTEVDNLTNIVNAILDMLKEQMSDNIQKKKSHRNVKNSQTYNLSSKQ